VRNLVGASMSLDDAWTCIPVIYNGRFLEAIPGLAAGDGSTGADLRPTAVDRLRRSFHGARRGITRALPSPGLRGALHSQRLEYGLRRVVYAAQNAGRWTRSLGADTASRVDFRRGDTLVLLDSTWSVDLTRELRRAREAGAAVWVVVNDLIPIQHPDLAPEGTPILFDKWLRRTVPCASGLIGISQTVTDDLREHLSRIGLAGPILRPALRVDYFYLGAGLDRIIATPHALDRVSAAFNRQQAASYIIVGTLEPRKNHARVLDAFEVLWSEGADLNLFIFGRLGWRSEALARRIRGHVENGRRLEWFESATDTEIDYAYRHASALIFASDCEGFGLPLVEAMEYGLPVLASDIPVFREIGADYPRYFNPHDPRGLVELIRSLEASRGPAARADARNPRLWLSWKDSARMLLEKTTAGSGGWGE
jgi:alpha-1,2-rhamnosyltransferase